MGDIESDTFRRISDPPAAGHADEREVEAVAQALAVSPREYEDRREGLHGVARRAIAALDAVRGNVGTVTRATHPTPCARCPTRAELEAELEREKRARGLEQVDLARAERERDEWKAQCGVERAGKDKQIARVTRAEAELRQARESLVAEMVLTRTATEMREEFPGYERYLRRSDDLPSLQPEPRLGRSPGCRADRQEKNGKD